MKKIAIFMLNLGGPRNLQEVKPFLVNMLSDKNLVPLPFNLGKMIALMRFKRVQKYYEEIGGGSPLLKWTANQGNLLCTDLNQFYKNQYDFKSFPCFTYNSPLIQEAIEQAASENYMDKWILFSQFPQFSCTTTQLSQAYFNQYLKSKYPEQKDKVIVVDKWCDNVYYIDAWTDLLYEQVKKLQDGKQIQICFTAHSIPLIKMQVGDPYPYQVGLTAYQIMKRLQEKYNVKLSFFISYQSKVGKSKWLEPSTKMAIQSIAEQNKGKEMHLILLPIAFTSDHLEVNHELDIQIIKGNEHKNINIVRTQSLNDHPTFIKALSYEVQERLGNLKGEKKQFKSKALRCVKCNTPDACKHSWELYDD